MVTILSVAFTPATGRTQERTSSPLICTEHAPHCATPHPYLVPVRPTCSRMTHKSGVSASTCTSFILPLMLSFAMNVLLRLELTANLIREVLSAAGCRSITQNGDYAPSRRLIIAHSAAFGVQHFRRSSIHVSFYLPASRISVG